MTYQELKSLFCAHEQANPRIHLTAHITFSRFGSTNKREYNRQERTYIISSNNKAFQPSKGGYSIYGSCLDGTECIRLERYMREEYGGTDGWIVEDCCIVGYMLAADEMLMAEVFYSYDAAMRFLTDSGEYDVQNNSVRVREVYIYSPIKITFGGKGL